MKDGKMTFLEDPPLIYHPPESDKLIEAAYAFFDEYHRSLADDKKNLLKRYRLEDVALKVVGVGSVGTRCFVGLFVVNEEVIHYITNIGGQGDPFSKSICLLSFEST